MARHDAKANSNNKTPKRATRSNKQLHQTLLTTHSPLTQQNQLPSPTHKKKNHKLIIDNLSSDESSTDSPVQLQYSDTDQKPAAMSEDDNLSDTTDQMDNTLDNLHVTRVD